MGGKEACIGVFDSGVGGISVLRHLRRVLPQEKFCYFGDSANAPYGVRPVEEVEALTLAAARRLVSRGIKALVVACNTATVAIEALRRRYPELLVIGIEPAVKLAADRHPGGTLAVLATPVTIRSQRLQSLCDRFAGDCTVVPLGVPGLAELVEADEACGDRARAILAPLLSPLAGRVDAVVLGCTHYPFAAPLIRELVGPGAELLDGGDGVARQTRRLLEARGLLREGPGELIIENSQPGGAMEALCRRLLET